MRLPPIGYATHQRHTYVCSVLHDWCSTHDGKTPDTFWLALDMEHGSLRITMATGALTANMRACWSPTEARWPLASSSSHLATANGTGELQNRVCTLSVLSRQMTDPSPPAAVVCLVALTRVRSSGHSKRVPTSWTCRSRARSLDCEPMQYAGKRVQVREAWSMLPHVCSQQAGSVYQGHLRCAIRSHHKENYPYA
jgi:hypothetical protein